MALFSLPGSCGALVDPEDIDKWLCDICKNDETQEAAVVNESSFLLSYAADGILQNPQCLLCPRPASSPPEQSFLGPPPDSFLRAYKPTEGQGWTHALCSVFIPEITFTDASRLRLVEGVSTITHHRWSAVSNTMNTFIASI